MARDTQRKPFSVFRSDAIDENERILEAGRQQRQENRERKEKGEAAPSIAPAPSTEAPVVETKTAATRTPVAETSTTITPTAETLAHHQLARPCRPLRHPDTKRGALGWHGQHIAQACHHHCRRCFGFDCYRGFQHHPRGLGQQGCQEEPQGCL